MADTSAAVTEHRRKRVRKGTKSCWECKRRKIRCDFLDSETVCAGCIERGTKCISQEFVDDQAPPSGTQLGQRMGRVEMLLEKLMQKVESNGIGTEMDDGLVPEARESLGIDVLTPSSSSSNRYENAPILSLFDNAVFGRSLENGTTFRNGTASNTSPPITSSQAVSPMTQTQSKLESLRQTLVAILPSQHDIELLLEASIGWWLIRRHILPQLTVIPDHDFSKPFSVQIVSQSHPIIISRLLLVVALALQQLPYDFDATRLHFLDSVKSRRDKIVNTIASVTSDDELIGSSDGIECLILQGAYNMNAGNLRRSWLCCRRAINIAQLMGIHRPSFRPNDPADLEAQGKHYLWFQLVKADRFLSLVLGLPAAGGSSELLPFDDGVAWLTPDDKYIKQLSMIAGLLIDRNQAEPTHTFSTTQNIDEKLEHLSKQMPSTWWEFPESIAFEQSEAVALFFDRALVQIYHYELESLLHLPYMLRAALDRRYEYSRLSCLSASRNLIKRWLFLREESKSPFICKIIEFQAFKAAITLLLGILQPPQAAEDSTQRQQEDEDRKTVKRVTGIFEKLQVLEGDVVLAQSAEVLKTLQGIDLNDHSKGDNIRLTIPHFGTITVGKSRCNTAAAKASPAPNTLDNANANAGFQAEASLQNWPSNVLLQQAPYPTPPPVFTFTSSQFPPLTADIGEWPFNDEDTLLFDSLLNTDLEGNWNF